jgi:hypothetical protein
MMGPARSVRPRWRQARGITKSRLHPDSSRCADFGGHALQEAWAQEWDRSEVRREEQGEDEYPCRRKRISSSSRPTAIRVSGREGDVFHCRASSNARKRLGAVFAFEGGTVLGRVRNDGFALGSDARPTSFMKRTNKSDLASSGCRTSTVMI